MNRHDDAGEKNFEKVVTGYGKWFLKKQHNHAHPHGSQQGPIKNHLHRGNGNKLSQHCGEAPKKNNEMEFKIILGCGGHRGTYLYKPIEINANTPFGNQAASKGGSEPVSAKVRVMVKNRMNTKDNINPRAI